MNWTCEDYATNHEDYATRNVVESISELAGAIPNLFIQATGAGEAAGDGNVQQALFQTLLPVLLGILNVTNLCELTHGLDKMVNYGDFDPLNSNWDQIPSASQACCACGGGIPAAVPVDGTPQDGQTVEALRKIYNSTNGHTWLAPQGWTDSDNFCKPLQVTHSPSITCGVQLLSLLFLRADHLRL